MPEISEALINAPDASKEYSREDLLSLCSGGIVPESSWRNRDSAGSQQQLGEAWALLSAGCRFDVLQSGLLKTDEKTVWIEIEFKGFGYFEQGEISAETYYIPTRERLIAAKGEDWY
jgi:hypothetical protein